MTINILEYGAISDKKTINTIAIQKAIDDCNAKGGGRVLVPSGNFVTGSIYLKDNVELHLEQGATLWASTDMSDYNADDAYEQNFGSPTNERWLGKHLIIAVEVKNVALTGNGVIDGRGEYFFGEPIYPAWHSGYVWKYGFSYPKDEKVLRPGQTSVFIECEDVVIKDVTFRNCTCWSCLLHGSERVQVRGVKVYNHTTFANTDGVDIDCCRYVTVSDCIILTGDDCITLRCSSKRLKKYRPCEYVCVSNCVLRASACGMRFGVGVGEIRNVVVNGLVIEEAGYGIMMQTKYGVNCLGKLENINVSNVVMNKSGMALSVIAREDGYVKNVRFTNVDAKTYAGIRIAATEEGEVSGITLKDCSFTVEKDVPELKLNEKSLTLRGEWVVKTESVKDVALENVKVFVMQDDDRWKGVFESQNQAGVSVINCNVEKTK